MEWMIGFAPFLMVIMIVWIVSRAKLESRKLKYTASETAEKAAQYVGQIKSLEDRVAVLERIVTDSGYNVSAQIEALRDVRRVEDEGAGVMLGTGNRERA
ncbi:hypothetical protein [Porphyrobacter sp. GA68]|uniref:hypothetical protein n=1 Tax=Porphyrobacter sp. GA68 TaxID=2883480 RepID=UPI001D18080A|nr:hypothetical protein [Porphyrobacter sp. GA68]